MMLCERMVTPTDINNQYFNTLTDSLSFTGTFCYLGTLLHDHETDWPIIGCYTWTNGENYNQDAVKLL